MIMQNFYVIIWHIHKYGYFIIIKPPLFKAFFSISFNERFERFG